jgi:hypothetical protein
MATHAFLLVASSLTSTLKGYTLLHKRLYCHLKAIFNVQEMYAWLLVFMKGGRCIPHFRDGEWLSPILGIRQEFA